MTEQEMREAIRLYRKSGYRRGEITLLCDLYDVSREEMERALAGVSPYDDIRRGILAGKTVNRLRQELGVSEHRISCVRRKMLEGGEQLPPISGPSGIKTVVEAVERGGKIVLQSRRIGGKKR